MGGADFRWRTQKIEMILPFSGFIRCSTTQLSNREIAVMHRCTCDNSIIGQTKSGLEGSITLTQV